MPRSCPTRARRATVTAGVVGAVMIGASEVIQLRGAGPVDIDPVHTRRSAVVVLGLPGKSAIFRSAQRWRVAKAMSERHRWAATTVVFTGGDPARMGSSEAAQMAAIAKQSGLPELEIILEENARSTWQNIVNSRPLVGDADVVIVVSDALHVRRALGYWHQQDPNLDRRVIGPSGHRLLDHFWITTPSTWVEVTRSIVSRVRAHRG